VRRSKARLRATHGSVSRGARGSAHRETRDSVPRETWGLPPRGARVVTLLLAAALVLLAPLADDCRGEWPPWSRKDDTADARYPDVTVSAASLADRLGDRGLVVVDARDAASYLRGHISGAISIPVGVLPAVRHAGSAFAALGLAGRERIICCGDEALSGDAALLFWFLETAGATNAAVLEGGLDAWVQGGGSIVPEPSTLREAAWKPAAAPERLATQEYVRLAFGEDGVEIVDARGADAWEGAIDRSQWGAPVRVGHIPHALPFDFGQFFTRDGTLRDPAETRSIFSDLGPRPSSPVSLGDEFIVHGDGISGNGAVGYLLLRRAGIERVRLFPGGWEQWLADTSLPVVRVVSAEELEHRLAGLGRLFKRDAPPGAFALFDVRHEGDWRRGHIPGAVGLSSRLFADSLEVVLDRHWPALDRRTAPVVTYCYGTNCIRSRYTSTTAARVGFLHVERFCGGVEDWRGIGGRLIPAPRSERPDGAPREDP